MRRAMGRLSFEWGLLGPAVTNDKKQVIKIMTRVSRKSVTNKAATRRE